MTTRQGFFVIELIVGFLLLQIITITAAGYLSYQTKLYQHCIQRMHALELVLDAIERSWPTQGIPQATHDAQYILSYELLKVAAHPTFNYGLVKVTYSLQGRQELVQLGVGSMEVVCR
jgi:Tfp pilus assembly protein PilE